MKKMPTWLKRGALALVGAAILIPILDRTVLASQGLTWRAGVNQCCIIFPAAAAIALLVWTGVLLWQQPKESLHQCVVLMAIGLLCLIVGVAGRFVFRISIPYEHVIERNGQRVVESSPPLDSGSNYYTCHGPLLRGTELLEGSYYLGMRKGG